MIRTRRVIASAFVAAAALPLAAGIAQATPAEEPQAQPSAATEANSLLPGLGDGQSGSPLGSLLSVLNSGLAGKFANGVE